MVALITLYLLNDFIARWPLLRIVWRLSQKNDLWRMWLAWFLKLDWQ